MGEEIPPLCYCTSPAMPSNTQLRMRFQEWPTRCSSGCAVEHEGQEGTSRNCTECAVRTVPLRRARS